MIKNVIKAYQSVVACSSPTWRGVPIKHDPAAAVAKMPRQP